MHAGLAETVPAAQADGFGGSVATGNASLPRELAEFGGAAGLKRPLDLVDMEAASAIDARPQPVPVAAAAHPSAKPIHEILADDRLAVDIASFLPGPDVARLAMTCRHWCRLLLAPVTGDPSASARWLWSNLINRDVVAGGYGSGLLRRPERKAAREAHRTAMADLQAGKTPQAPPVIKPSLDDEPVGALIEAYSVARTAAKANQVCWRQLRISGGKEARAMEGHSAAIIDDRHIVMIGGFGRGIANEVCVLDTWLWKGWVPARLTEPRRPRPKYGHACAAISKDTIAVFGGFMFGGYMGDVNDLQFLKISIDHRPTEAGPFGCSATWQTPRPAGVDPSSRGYPSLTAVGPFLFVFGGIHQGSVCDTLEVLYMPEGPTGQLTWTRPTTNGTPPSPRMGQSAVFLPDKSPSALAHGYGKLIVAGGSDGSDLLRDGRDFQDVHVLTIGPPDPASTSTLPVVSLSWSQPQLSNNPFYSSLGRAHTAHHIGEGQVMYFGGSARLSNQLSVLDASSEDPSHWAWRAPQHEHGQRPMPRVSHVSVRTGRHVWVHGGWHGEELGDMWMLDLAAALPCDRKLDRRAASHRTQHHHQHHHHQQQRGGSEESKGQEGDDAAASQHTHAHAHAHSDEDDEYCCATDEDDEYYDDDLEEDDYASASAAGAAAGIDGRGVVCAQS